jgi:hypothetical protein
MRRAAAVDGNHREIVRALEQIGASVQSLATIGDGCPDLLVGYHGRNWLMEIKDPRQDPCKRELRPDQRRFFIRWRGQVAKIETVDQAIALVTSDARPPA